MDFLAAYWWSYISSVHLRNPRAMILVKKAGEQGFSVNPKFFIRFKVYGDNHIIALCRDARKYISYSAFVKFVANLGISIHEERENIPFLSTPDSRGGLKERGVVFLKRYFVEQRMGDIGYVLPYKQWIDVAPKIVFGNSMRVNLYDYAIALCGLAWDSMGTNRQLHDVLKFLFAGVCTQILKEGKTPYASYMLSLSESENNMAQKLSRKLFLTYEELTNFPDLKMLLERHTYIPEKHWYRRVPKMRGMLWEDDIQGDFYPNTYPHN